MPWQRQVADVALEVDDDGKLVYREVILTVPRQSGKGLAVDTALPTPDGWVSMGDVRVGDALFDESGAPCRVTYVSPDRRLDCYRVEFSDGTHVIADGDHLWTVFDIWRSGGSRTARHGAWVTLETREMLGAEIGTRGKLESRYRLPNAGPLQCPASDLPIDPWLLGAWLGDGTSSQAALTVGGEDLDEMVSMIEAAGIVVKVRSDATAMHVALRSPAGPYAPDAPQRVLRRMGVLGNKRIPVEYLRSSVAQRLALLQGLMDTDGTVTVKGTNRMCRQCEFSVCNEALARDVSELLRSLGIRSSFKSGPAKINGRQVGTRYRLQFVTELPVFRLSRKARRHAEQAPLRKRARTIRRVTPVPSVVTRCIQVDSPSALFRCGDGMVPTHNTTLLLPLMVDRALFFGSPQRIVYTAQTRNDARRKWEDDQIPTLLHSAFGSHFEIRKANGGEAIRWLNGSLHTLMATTSKSGHGSTLDLAVIDEAFAQSDFRLEQATKPAMITRPEPQTWVVSTAGTAESVYLQAKVDAGRAAVDGGVTEGVCYFEWSAADGLDPGDPATWWSCMPALGHTITEAAVAADYLTMREQRGEFERAYLNRWTVSASEPVISPEVWAGLKHEASQPSGQVCFAFDVTPDHGQASIVVCGDDGSGRSHVELVDHRQGTQWLPARLAELVQRWSPQGVYVDPAGPAGSMVPAVEAAGVVVTSVVGREVAQAAGLFFEACMDGRLVHLGQPLFDSAIGGAIKRPVGDLWSWSRAGSSVDISPLVAATLALWGSRSLQPADVMAWVL